MGRPRSFDEGTAVEAATALFCERGYDGTGVDDLVRALGMHRGSLYQAFGSKRGLWLRALRAHVGGLAGPDDDLTLLLRAAVERAPTDVETAVLVSAGLARIRSTLPADDDLARVLGERLITRAAPRSTIEEDR
ncbi:TetR/AcrR family transcriptional regulator [Blastococcus sp. CT_GayMR19]|uniref:TetR/AcrR family transcriptional regulator n=1 Tax=Blastococcus sp. CT_GayMR19 TaxID=2559608 RepID=UPI001073157B|nr:helix-turn-helix domain-containing protein [Blastococcus sp. CT_GayMR19]TFV77562.1 TetR/AcrR family transcriptional regulator [Blastococcus sp. CT_GayMR19]